MKTLEIVYEFSFDDGRKFVFPLKLDAGELTMLSRIPDSPPAWTRLEFSKCKNCPLDPVENKYCKIAVNMVEVVEKFGDVSSVEEAEVTVRTPERICSRRLPVQKGLSSLIGIYMTTSGCPILSGLKSMVRYHLPFATVEETIFRSVSSYLLGQYFEKKKGRKPDWELKRLTERYAEIEKVNEMMSARLRAAIKKDSSVNAIVILDVFAKFVPMTIDAALEKLEYLFRQTPPRGK